MDLGPMRPSGAAATLAKAAKVLDLPVPTRLDNRYLLSFIPPVPENFFGSVTYNFKEGRIMNVEINESIKP